MRNARTYVLAVVACLLAAGSLQAQTATGQMQWVGTSGPYSSYSSTGVGSPTWTLFSSPYLASFEIPSLPTNASYLPPAGMSAFGPATDIYCVDFNSFANTGTSSVLFTNLGTDAASVGISTKSNSLQRYLAAAYLAKKIAALPSMTGKFSGAIWSIFSGQPAYWLNGNGVWVNLSSLVSDALTTGYLTVNPYDWAVVTEGTQSPNGIELGESQEYITHVTPEPASMLLLGTGLVVMLLGAGAFRRPTVL